MVIVMRMGINFALDVISTHIHTCTSLLPLRTILSIIYINTKYVLILHKAVDQKYIRLIRNTKYLTRASCSSNSADYRLGEIKR